MCASVTCVHAQVTKLFAFAFCSLLSHVTARCFYVTTSSSALMSFVLTQKILMFQVWSLFNLVF